MRSTLEDVRSMEGLGLREGEPEVLITILLHCCYKPVSVVEGDRRYPTSRGFENNLSIAKAPRTLEKAFENCATDALALEHA